MTMTDDLVTEARKGGPCAELGDRCRAIEAASGCFCAAVADRIEALTAQLQVSNELGRALEEDAGQLREDNARLRAALERIAKAEPRPKRSGDYDRADVSALQRIARTALKEPSHD
jgi:hypothetical protein